MTDKTTLTNRALQAMGTRTTVTAAELANNTSNEAIQTNLIYVPTRDDLLRMAPWNCWFTSANLTYITSAFGTPENAQAPPTSLWGKGQPAPPWAYEYQVPPDCLFAAWITPQSATGFAGGVPITTAVTGGAPSFWQGPPVKFKEQVDQFLMVTAAAVVAGGAGYVVGDLITVALQPTAASVTNILGTFGANLPQGAPAILQVTAIGGGGSVTTAVPVNQIMDETTVSSGSYFYANTATATQGATTGAGAGATFNLTFAGPFDQRIILTNQEFGILNYCRRVTDENVWDTLFQTAFINVLAAQLAFQLTGDKGVANQRIAIANDAIQKARGRDGNEGLTVNDVLPDWIRVRGINFTEDYSGPYNTGFNWGALWPGYT